MISKAEQKLIYPLALLVSTAKRKTCESIALATGKSGDALLRLLNEGFATIEDLVSIAKKLFIGKVLYLIIDDTIISKIHSKMIQGTSDNYDSSSGNTYRSLCSVTAMISDGYTAIPISQKIWTAQEFTKDTYKKKSELSQELITIIRSYLNVKMFLTDGLYATQEMMQWLIAANLPFEMRFHANRVIDYQGNKIAIRDLPELKLAKKRSRRTIRALWKGMVLYFTAIKRATKKGVVTIVYQVSNCKASARQHTQWYGYRWKVEMFFRTSKQHLGLGDCQSRKSKAQHNHIMNVFFVYALLQIERKKLKLKNTEAVIKHLKHKSHPQLIARFMRSDRIFDEVYA